MQTLRTFVIIISADWPAMSKITGYSYHSAFHPCRMCLKSSTYSNVLKSSSVLPIGTKKDMLLVISGNMYAIEKWLEQECPFRRSDQSTRRFWKQLENAYIKKLPKKEISNLVRNHGIRSEPIFSLLKIDFVLGLPYDYMHQILLGVVKHLLSLCSGMHHKCATINCSYTLREEVLIRINQSLNEGRSDVPSIGEGL